MHGDAKNASQNSTWWVLFVDFNHVDTLIIVFDNETTTNKPKRTTWTFKSMYEICFMVRIPLQLVVILLWHVLS